MITFTVSLTQNQWNKELGGWNCPVLKIPGAKVDAFYDAGTKRDDALYQVDVDHEIVRWTSDPVPVTAALAVRLTQDLAPKEQRDFWKGFGLFVPIITTVISAAVTYMVATQAHDAKLENAKVPKEAAGPFYERWTVTGRVATTDPSLGLYHVYTMMKPPEITFNELGKFEADIPILAKENGLRIFPSLTFAVRQAGFKPVTVELGDNRTHTKDAAKAGATDKQIATPESEYRPPDFGLKLDQQNKLIDIGKIIQLARDEQPYSEKRAASEQSKSLEASKYAK